MRGRGTTKPEWSLPCRHQEELSDPAVPSCHIRTRMAFSLIKQQAESQAEACLPAGLQQGPPGVQRLSAALAGATDIRGSPGSFAMALKAATRNGRSSPCQQMH